MVTILRLLSFSLDFGRFGDSEILRFSFLLHSAIVSHSFPGFFVFLGVPDVEVSEMVASSILLSLLEKSRDQTSSVIMHTLEKMSCDYGICRTLDLFSALLIIDVRADECGARTSIDAQNSLWRMWIVSSQLISIKYKWKGTNCFAFFSRLCAAS